MKLKQQAFRLSLFLAVLGIASAALAQTPKVDGVRLVPVKKMFPYYDLYLSLPPQDRDGFLLEYIIKSEGVNVRPRMFYALGSTRTPIQLDPRGKVLTMPDLTLLREGKIEIQKSAPSGSITLNLDPVVPLARTIPASAVANSVSDYSKAISRAGPLALAIPKLTGIGFKGVASGQAIFPDGRKTVLPLEAGVPIFRPNHASMRGAVSLEFPSVPSAAQFTR